VAFAVLAFAETPAPMQIAGIGVATIGLLMICGTVGFEFSVGAFAVLMISPVSFAIGNLLLRQARQAPMFDLSPGSACAALRCWRWRSPSTGRGRRAVAVADVGDRMDQHDLRRRDLHLHRLLLWAACCAITPPRRWCRSRCWFRSSAPRRRASCSAKPSSAAAGRDAHVVGGIAIMLLSKRAPMRRIVRGHDVAPAVVALSSSARSWRSRRDQQHHVLSSGLTYGLRRSLPVSRHRDRSFIDGWRPWARPGGHLHRLSCCRPS